MSAVTIHSNISTSHPAGAGPVKTVLRTTALAAALLLAGCQADELGYGPKHQRPLGYAIKADMTAKKMQPEDPIMVRLFKEESALEVWKRTKSGKFDLLKTYEICKWSGKLGPKKKEGDRQAPEGFYTIRPAQMNPNSSYHLSFNMGFPNAFDRAYGRTGSELMVHGACSSRGCYAMTDEQIQEIYTLAREAFRGGQRDFQVEAYPFRMTAENMARHHDDENMPFWRMLKRGYDHFEVTRQVPKVDVCDKSYVFDAVPDESGKSFVADRACPAYTVPEPIRTAVAAKQRIDDQKTTMIVAGIEAKRAREAAWKAQDTAPATSEPAAAIAGATPASSAAPETATTTALGYAPADGTPVPLANPVKAPGVEAPKSAGFFSSLFSGDTATPAVAPRAQSAQPPANAGGVPLPAAAPEAEATPGASPETRGSKVSDVVSRWFSFGKNQAN